MINKTKKMILIMIISLTITLISNKVLAFQSYTGNGATGSSDACENDFCGGMIFDYFGIRITFMKKNNLGKLESAKPSNFKKKTYYLLNSNFANFYSDDDDVIEISNFKDLGGNEDLSWKASSFPSYLSNDNLALNNNKLVKNMLKKMYSDYETNSNLSGYYMEIEPFVRFKITDNVNSTAYYFDGTPSTIVKNLMSKGEAFYNYNKTRGNNPLSTIVKPFAVVSSKINEEDKNRCSWYTDDLKKLIGTTGEYANSDNYWCGNIFGEWNVLRNYFTALKIDIDSYRAKNNNEDPKPYTKYGVDEGIHSARAFQQIHDISIYGKTLIKLSDFGIATCESDFDASDKSIQSRYNIFVKYGKKFNNLLNFNAKTGEQACQKKSCEPSECRVDDWQENYATCNSKSNSCLNYNYESSAEDYSCYSELKLKDDEKTLNYICNTDFKFENKLGTTSFNVWPGLRLTGTDGLIGTARVFKRCYVNSGTPQLFLKYSDNKLKKYVESIKFNGETLSSKLSTISRKSDDNEEPTIAYDAKTKKFDNNYISYNGSNELNNVMVKTNYGHEYVFFDYDIYASNKNLEKGTGAKEETILENHSYETVRGVFTSYNWRKTSSGEIPFQIEFTKKGQNAHLTNYDSTGDANKCTYNVSNNGLFSKYNWNNNNNNNLNLEFRIIDTKNPFTKKGSNDSRNTMTNWCDKTAKENPCIYNNNVVKKYITNKPNSYGFVNGKRISSSKIKYKITLTPQVINDIKEQAALKNITYNKFNLTCKDKKCTSELLTHFKDNGVLTINGSSKR